MTRTEAERYVELTAKAFGPPVKGTQPGPGPHVPMTDDPASPGWTYGGESVHERSDEPGIWDAPAAGKLGDLIDLMRLTGPERVELVQLIAKAK